MKVLMINGSPKSEGSTATALKEIAKILDSEGIESEIFNIGTPIVRDCTGCGKCRKNGGVCAFDDDCVNELIARAGEADGFIFGTPVYYAHPSGMLLSLLNRVFYAGGANFAHKPGATIACARRAGTTTSLDVLNKYLTISQMPVISSTYWNGIYGRKGEEVLQDEEGRQTLENLARNMAWMLKCISLAKEQGIEPPKNPKVKRTNFIR